MNGVINVQKGSHPVRVGQTKPSRRGQVPAVPGASARGGAQKEGGRADGRQPWCPPWACCWPRSAALDSTCPVGGAVRGNACRHERARLGEQGARVGGCHVCQAAAFGRSWGSRRHRGPAVTCSCAGGSGGRRLGRETGSPTGTCRSPARPWRWLWLERAGQALTQRPGALGLRPRDLA